MGSGAGAGAGLEGALEESSSLLGVPVVVLQQRPLRREDPRVVRGDARGLLEQRARAVLLAVAGVEHPRELAQQRDIAGVRVNLLGREGVSVQ